jgi:hypothetical protein
MIEAEAYLDPANFYITNPNLGRSVDAEWLRTSSPRRSAAPGRRKQVFLAKHLNVEIGLRLRTPSRWRGADYWEAPPNRSLTLAELKRRCEVAVVGIDGGGLDDLLGLTVLGRETRHAAAGSRLGNAWVSPTCSSGARRSRPAARLRGRRRPDHLRPGRRTQDDGRSCRLNRGHRPKAGLLPEAGAVGLDAAGVATLVDELIDRRDHATSSSPAVAQGYRLPARSGAWSASSRTAPGATATRP